MKNNQHPSRRSQLLIRLFIVFVGVAGFNAAAIAQNETRPLQNLAPSGFAVGGVLHGYDPKWNQGNYAQTAEREFNAITATAYMPWIGWSGPNVAPNTSGLTDIINWAQARGKRVHGHTLLYPAANRSLAWYQNPNINHTAIVQRYINAMGSAGAGRMWVWDVVNEVMADPGDSRVDNFGLRNDFIEYTSIGSDYVDKAFAWAKAADPDALLIINDYGAEVINEKSNNLLRYVTELRRRGVPIDGVGFQMHIFAHFSEPDYDSIRRNFQRFANAGFQIFITEMDVPIKQTTNAADVPNTALLQRQRRVFERITAIAMEQPAVKSLLLWDYADERSWLHPVRNSLGNDFPAGTYTFPTPFTESSIGARLTKKPGYFGIAAALSGADDVTLDGRYELISRWRSSDGYLHQRLARNASGQWQPADDVVLYSNFNWVAGQWNVLSAGNGFYRLQNRRSGDYLTRRGLFNGTGYDPSGQLQFHPLREDWTSQLWQLTPAGNGSYWINNGWTPNSGYLTRKGTFNGVGWDPSRSASLLPLNTQWSSQRWQLERIN